MKGLAKEGILAKETHSDCGKNVDVKGTAV